MKSFRLNFFLKSILPVVFCMFFGQLAFAQVDFEILDGDAQICAGDSTLLSIDATVDSIRWSPTNGLSMPEALSTFVSPSMNTTYFATLYFNGMTEVVPIQVDIISEATLGNNVTVCSNGGTLAYDFTDLPFPGDYTLTNSNGFAISESPDNVFAVDINGTPAGTYDLIVTNPDCNQADTIQVTVVDGLAAELNLQEEDRAICNGDELSLSVASVAGQTYEWTGNGILLSSTNSVTNTPTVTTTYVVSTIGTTCSIPTQDSVTIIVSNFPAIALPETINGCENDTIQLGNNIAQAGTTYSWNPTDNIVDPTAVNADLFVVEDGTYILTANNGCEIMDTVEVTLIPNDIMLQDTILVCLGDSVTIPFTTNPPNDEVVWTTIDGALANVPTPFTVTPDDVVSFIATVDNLGCTFTDTVTLQVDSLPMNIDLSFMEFNDAPAPICVGDTVIITSTTFDEAFFPNIEYQWQADGNNLGSTPDILTPDTAFNVVFIGQQTRIYSRIATNGACVDTVEVEVPVVPILTVEVTPEDEVCPGTSVELTGTASDPLNGGAVIDPDDIEWEWMFMPGTIEPAEGMGENTPTATLESSTGQGMVTATYLGCPSMGDFTIPVAAIPQLAFPFSPVCLGDDTGLNSAPPFPSFEYNWASTANDLAGQETSPNPLVTPLAQTTYSVTVTNFTASDEACEPVTDQVTIDVFDTAEILTDPILITSCIVNDDDNINNDNIEVTINLPADYIGGPDPTFTFTPQSGGPSFTTSDLSIDITFTPDMVGENTFIIFVDNDCVDNTMIGTAIVTILQNPRINIICDTLSANETLFEGDMLNLTVSPITPGVTYTWASQNGGNFNPNPGSSTVHSVTGSEGNLPPDTDDTDSITVTASLEGCVDEDATKDLEFEPSNIQLPNIFTPGQSTNSVFRIRAPDNVEILDLIIYDRWGNKVYENDNVAQEWDGSINGEQAPSEVYIYTVTYQIPGQDPVTASRDLTLLR